MKTVRAKFDAGLPNDGVKRFIVPKANKSNKKVWPEHEMGGYRIVKGELYEIDDKLELEYFEQVSGAKKVADEQPAGKSNS